MGRHEGGRSGDCSTAASVVAIAIAIAVIVAADDAAEGAGVGPTGGEGEVVVGGRHGSKLGGGGALAEAGSSRAQPVSGLRRRGNRDGAATAKKGAGGAGKAAAVQLCEGRWLDSPSSRAGGECGRVEATGARAMPCG